MLPEQVKRQLEEVTKIEEELSGTREESDTVEGQMSASQEDESLTQDSSDSPKEDSMEKADSQTDPWEHKYRVLQGKYNAEVPRLHEEIRQIQKDNEFLRGKLELLERLLADKSSESQYKAESEAESDEVSKFREEFPDIYRAVVKLLDSRKETVRPETERQLEQVASQAQQAALVAFQLRLSSLVPDWEQLNTDSDFISWLKHQDRFSRKTRHELMLEAFRDGDADSVAEFFKAYKSENSSRPQQSMKPRNIAPSGGRSGSPSAQSKRTFKQSEIEDFYRMAALGKIDQSVKEATEREILKAMREDRVLFNQ